MFPARHNDNGRILTSLVGDERILQTTPPEPPDSSATRSRMKSPANKVNVNFFPAGIRVQKQTYCDISHQFSRPRAWRCHRRCLWQRTWSWTEGTSQPTDAYWGLSWQMIIIFGSGTVNEWTMNSDIRSHYNPTWQGLKALSSEDIPDLDGGIGIAGDQDVVSQLHPRGQALDIKS